MLPHNFHMKTCVVRCVASCDVQMWITAQPCTNIHYIGRAFHCHVSLGNVSLTQSLMITPDCTQDRYVSCLLCHVFYLGIIKMCTLVTLHWNSETEWATWRRWTEATAEKEKLFIFLHVSGLFECDAHKANPTQYYTYCANCMAGLEHMIQCICSFFLSNTVKQENFTTGKFREFAASGGSRQENFANLWLEDFLSFKISPCLSKSEQ